MAEHGRRWRQIKDLEEDYEVYVSDEYAHHISEGGLKQEVIHMSHRVEFDETLQLRTATQYKHGSNLTFGELKSQRQSSEKVQKSRKLSSSKKRLSSYHSSQLGDAGDYQYEKED